MFCGILLFSYPNVALCALCMILFHTYNFSTLEVLIKLWSFQDKEKPQLLIWKCIGHSRLLGQCCAAHLLPSLVFLLVFKTALSHSGSLYFKWEIWKIQNWLRRLLDDIKRVQKKQKRSLLVKLSLGTELQEREKKNIWHSHAFQISYSRFSLSLLL